MPYYEFPHTRNYDNDLGFIIREIERLSKLYDDIIKNIDQQVGELIEIRFNNLMINAIYDPATETITLKKGVLEEV